MRSLYRGSGRSSRAVVSYLRMEAAQQLIVYTAEPGFRSEQAMRELAAWAAEHICTSR